MVTTEDETLDSAMNRSLAEKVDTDVVGRIVSDGVDDRSNQVRNTQAHLSPIKCDLLQDPSQTTAVPTSSEALPTSGGADGGTEENSHLIDFGAVGNSEPLRNDVEFGGEYSRLKEKRLSSCSSDSDCSRRITATVLEHSSDSSELPRDISDSSVRSRAETDKLGLTLKFEDNSNENFKERQQEQPQRALDTSLVGVGGGSSNSSSSLQTSSSTNSSSRPSPASLPGGTTPSPATSNEAAPSSSHSSDAASNSAHSSVALCTSDSFAVITSSSCSTSPSVEVREEDSTIYLR